MAQETAPSTPIAQATPAPAPAPVSATPTQAVLGAGPTKQQLHPEWYSCRMYENKYPELEEHVVVMVKNVNDIGAYVSLLEYNNVEGLILQSEFSRRRIKSINKLVRVGKQEVVVVLRVDTDKGYIDLSKRRVSSKDYARTEERYNKSKAVASIIRQLAETHEMSMESLYQMCAWPLFKKFGHAFDAFKQAINEPEKVFEGMNIPEPIYSDLEKLIKRRLTPQAVKIRADIEVTCFHYEGIEAIKSALAAGEACSTEQSPIQIKLLAPPTFVMFTTSTDKAGGIATLNKAIDVIKAEISKYQGELIVAIAPRAITETEDNEFAKVTKKPSDGSDSDEDSDEDSSSDEDDSSGDEDEDSEEEEGLASGVGPLTPSTAREALPPKKKAAPKGAKPAKPAKGAATTTTTTGKTGAKLATKTAAPAGAAKPGTKPATPAGTAKPATPAGTAKPATPATKTTASTATTAKAGTAAKPAAAAPAKPKQLQPTKKV